MHTRTHTVPQKFLQTGVTEAVSTGRHLDRLPHRLAAQRTLEASLWLFQKLVIKPGHRCGFCRYFWAFRLQVAYKTSFSSDPPGKRGYLAALPFKPMGGSYHVPSASDRSSFRRHVLPSVSSCSREATKRPTLDSPGNLAEKIANAS